MLKVSLEARTYWQRFVVVDGLSTNVICGCDFLKNNRVTIDMAGGQIVFDKSLAIQLIRRNEYLGVARLSSDVTIWAGGHREIPIYVRNRSYGGEIELRSLTDPVRGLRIRSKTCQLDNAISLIVSNRSDRTIHLRKNGPIANCIRVFGANKLEVGGGSETPDTRDTKRQPRERQDIIRDAIEYTTTYRNSLPVTNHTHGQRRGQHGVQSTRGDQQPDQQKHRRMSMRESRPEIATVWEPTREERTRKQENVEAPVSTKETMDQKKERVAAMHPEERTIEDLGLQINKDKYVKEDISEFTQVIQDNVDLFAMSNSELPACKWLKAVFKLKDPNAKPVRGRVFQHSMEAKKEIEKQINQILKDGFIERSCSPFTSSNMLVKKRWQPQNGPG